MIKFFRRDPYKIKPAKGKYLDNMAYQYGLKRERRLYGLLPESNKKLRGRLLDVIDHLKRNPPYETVYQRAGVEPPDEAK